MISPSKNSDYFDYGRKQGIRKETTCWIHYGTFSGSFEGIEVYAPIVNEWVFIPEEQFSELQKKRYQDLIDSHVESKRAAEREYSSDDVEI